MLQGTRSLFSGSDQALRKQGCSLGLTEPLNLPLRRSREEGLKCSRPLHQLKALQEHRLGAWTFS